MMITRTAFLALVGWALFTASAAARQATPCGDRGAIVARLAEKYGESRQSIGIGGNNTLVEVFASRETGSWTILMTTAEGRSCLIASGQNYEALAETLPATSERDA